VAQGQPDAVHTLRYRTLTTRTVSHGFTPTAVYVLGPSGEQMTEMTNSCRHLAVGTHEVLRAATQRNLRRPIPRSRPEGQLYLALSDWLGTRRQQTDYAGNPCLTFSSLPYR